MAIKITKPSEPIIIENIIVTIYGNPGSGKTSLALSADKPLLLDFDNGVHRALIRKDAVLIHKWQDVEDLNAEVLADYNTIVVDTVGRMLEILALYLISKTPKLGRGTGDLTLQGYGALSLAFKGWLNKIKSYKKDIVLIGHAKESNQNDQNIVRIDALGSSKDEILKCSDLLGFLEQNSQGRILNFNSTDKNLGKNCAELDVFNIPNLKLNEDYLANIIKQSKDKINSLSEEYIQRQKYLNEFKEQLETLETADDFTGYTLLDFVLKDVEFKLLLKDKAESKGYKYNKESKKYESTTTLEK